MLSGARSLPLSMVAAVTAEGGHAAIVGQPDVGLLAAVEMGADLSRIAVIPEPGADPVEVAAVLMDGMDLVVLGLGGRSVPAGRAGRWWPGRGRRAAPCWSPAATGRGRPPGWRPGSAAMRSPVRAGDHRLPGAGGSAGCGWPCGPGPLLRHRSCGRRMSVFRVHLASAGRLVHGLARGRRVAAAGLPPTTPVAVTLANRVIACSASARAAGVRRGLRRRESQARCPELHVVTADPGARRPPFRRRDGRGGRPGAAGRGAAARSVGVVGARRGPLLRVRAGRR